jgi:DNA-binding transcriptional MerR regulator
LATAGEKDPGALLTIGELSLELGVAQHILRYWETRFPQLRPMQRAGNRRYYRPADVELARRINRLLNQEGYTVRGVQKLLRDRGAETARSPAEVGPPPSPMPASLRPEVAPAAAGISDQGGTIDVFRLIALRNRLLAALEP